MSSTSIPWPDAGSFRLITLGAPGLRFRAPDATETVILGPGKPLALLVYLNQSPRLSASRDHLVDLLWSDVDPLAGRHSFRQTIYYLKKRLGDSAFTQGDETIGLSAALPSDRDAFAAAMQAGDFECAVGRYTGDFVTGFRVPGGSDFEQWAEAERRRLFLMFVRAAEAVSHAWLSSARFGKAQQLARRVRDADPLDERGWRMLLDALITARHTTDAAVEADALERLLAAEDRDPEPATRRLLDLAREQPSDVVAGDSRVMLVSDLVGREREFAAIIRRWEEARRGRGGHLHLSADAGFGKTRLLSDIHARLKATGARVVSVRAHPGGRAIPCAVAGELAAQLGVVPGAGAVSPSAASLLVGLSPSLSSRLVAAADVKGGAADLSRRRARALCEMTQSIADEGAVAVLIDDLHWADAASRQMVEALGATVQNHRALLVTASRPRSDGPAIGHDAETIALEPLSTEHVALMVASIGRVPPETWAEVLPDALHRDTQGSPLLVMETLQALREDGLLMLDVEGWRCPSPSALVAALNRGGALVRRVQSLDRGANWLLLVLATAGMGLDAEQLGNASGRTPDAAEAELCVLEHRGLVRRVGSLWEAAHDEIAEIAVQSADRVAQVAAHAAVAAELTRDVGADVDWLLRAGGHLVRSSQEAELHGLLRRCVAKARLQHDPRTPRELAQLLLGDDADPGTVSRLVSTLPLSLRPTRSSVARAAAVVGLVAILGVIAGILIGRLPARAADARLLIIERTAGGDTVARRVSVQRQGWPRAPVFDALSAGEQYRGPMFPGYWSEASVRSDGTVWVVGRAVGDSGAGNDLFLVDEERRERRLTYAPGDDLGGAWSPDGGQVTFRTTRWNAHARADIATVDLATGVTRQLTHGDAVDENPIWSPDGSRVAFVRNGGICLVNVDGTGERCLARSSSTVITKLLAWHDAGRLLAALRGPRSGAIAMAYVDDDSLHRIMSDSIIGDPVASPDGQWIACTCQTAGLTASELRVFPVDSPDRVAVYGAPEGSGVLVARWLSGGVSRGPISRVVISKPLRPLPAGVSTRLVARAFDSSGVPMVIVNAAWMSSDSTIARVNPRTGVVYPLRAGRAMIRVSVGGWRSAWTSIDIVGPAVVRVLGERWRSVDSQWVAFGEPRPHLAVGPGGIRALDNNGDGIFESGVYSRDAFDGDVGLGAEFRLSTKLTALQNQRIGVWLRGGADSAMLASWNHVSGYLPSALGGGLCGMAYPSNDRDMGKLRISLPGDSAVAKAALRTGAWYTVRLQVFPDGSCGVAVDGTAIWREPIAESSHWPYRIIIQGASVGSKILVGPLEVWRGVRTDVDWLALGRRRLIADR